MCPQPSAVCESLCDWGETLCAASPNPTTVITAGASSVVCVWDVVAAKDKVTRVKLRQVRFISVLFCVCRKVPANIYKIGRAHV